ncbi:MAG: dethiobiotin synthase [Betaproteobacteria bacterium]|nr:dethiobiotin synthase [Betaproteobacteria bacterium]
MSQAYFLTGTDTEIGKTFTACALLHAACAAGFAAAGLKPVAAGVDAAGRNEDVDSLVAASSVALPPEVINPYCFHAAVAPHIAAAEEGRAIDFAVIADAVAAARRQADFVIVEGVGGFRVPLGVDRDSADLAVALGLPVILVVGLRLGCINHALLSAEAIADRGLPLAGWVANTVDRDMARREENIAALGERLTPPLLGVLPRLPGAGPQRAAAHLRLPGVSPSL